MSSEVNVHSIAALEELRSALMRFKDEAQIALTTMALVIERTRAWLQESLQRWQGELRRRQRALEEAQAALKACLVMAAAASIGSGGYAAVDCSPLEVKVSQAKRRVEEAEQEIRTIQYFIKATEEAVASYQKQANRLNNSLENELLKGAALLSRSVSILSSYASGSPTSSSTSYAAYDTPPAAGTGAFGSSANIAGEATERMQFDSVYVSCPKCGGSGNEDVECNPCGGTGHRFDGTQCPHCNGLGKKAVSCLNCDGSGSVLKD